MEDWLYTKDLYDPIEGESARSKDTSDTDWKKMNRKAVAIIRQWLDLSVYPHVEAETNTHTMWNKLKELYERKNVQNKACLIRKLVNMKYKDGESMAEHMSVFQNTVNQLTATDIKLDDELQALLLLSSLPDNWEVLVVTLTNSAPSGKLVMSTVKESMLNEEARRKERGLIGSPTQSEALVTESRGRNQSKNFYKRDKSESRGKSRARKEFTCFYCNREGHIKKYCRLLKRDQLREKDDDSENESDKDTSAVSHDSTTDVYIICDDDDSINLVSHDSTWIIDSGASYHVTPRRDFFSSYTIGDFGTVKMGNEGVCKIVGMGDVWVETSIGCKLQLKNVRHVPDIRLNLISVKVLDIEGYHTYFGGGGICKITKGSLVVANEQSPTSLYRMPVKLCKEEVNAVEDVSTDLWHTRLGHLSQKGLNILLKKNFLPVKGTPLKTCTHCFSGKQHRVSFRSSGPHRRQNILDLIHTDVCMMDSKSLGGALYFVTFIDDHSRKVWAFVLKSKDQVLGAFKQFHASVERETGRKLKCIRADNGGEYRGPFEEYCKEHGIKLEKTVPKTPQHNGVAERMNRTINERVRCMLSHAKLSKAFWGEAMKTAVDLINLSPSIPLDGDVPNRVWTGKDVSYGYLRVFGCRAFVHIPRDERSKLDKKSKQCLFMGYGNEQFGYKLWDPVDKKIIRSRDVIFLEDQTIENFDKAEKQKSDARSYIDVVPKPPSRTLVDGGDVQVDDENITDDHTHDHDDPVEEEPPEPSVEPLLRRSSRERQVSQRYPPHDYVTVTDNGEPEHYQEAIANVDKEKWFKAMQEEMNSLHENHTFELVKLPKGKRALKNKWVYKIKSESDQSQPRYKARLVVKGFNQRKGIDFEEIFSPVVKMTSIRVVLGLAASLNLEVEQLDVKTAFLHGDLEEELYMEQPEGFEVKGKEELVCRLKKSLYGLKQAPRQWYKKFDSFMEKHGYDKTTADHCVFVKKFSDGDFIILLLYVDDMLIVGHDTKKIKSLKKELSMSFAMKDLGPAKQILGMRISRDRKNGKLWLSQHNYIEKVLERFNMSKAKPVSTPLAGHLKLSSEQCPTSEKDKEDMKKKIPYASAVGSLMYAMVCTRPDIAHAVGVVSRFLSNPGKDHWQAVKWILRYLRGTSKVCLCFGGGDPVLDGYTDADMAGDLDCRKSTSGYMMTFAEAAVSWQSRLQKCVALSTTEAEYIAATEAAKELLWMKKFLQELGIEQEKFMLFCDSQSAIHLGKNPTFHSRSKHIEVRYHWIREALEMKSFSLEKIHTDENGSDMMTKTLPVTKMICCRKKAGMVERSLPT
ncbi:unnamed protein product [Trifolium pratense]|uniref:Uncharacterized protein n=1 Tax=Trifolium pratense TaxID=57577 RepID=A0ACB0KQG1_TRIPR|nr:unnamed protein product [Trifolium pratense]